MADEDVRLGISAVDRGAARLVRGVADALRALSSVQAQQVNQTRAQATATRNAADALSQQARFARAAVADEENRLARFKEASRQRIAAIRAEREEAVRAAKVMAKANADAAKGMLAMRKEALREASRPITFRDPSGRQVTFRDEARIAARRRDVAREEEALARAKAIGRQLIAQARQVGTAEEAEARRTVAAQRRVLQAKRDRAREAVRLAREAEQNSRREERASARVTAALRQQSSQTQTLNQRMTALRRTVLNLVFAYSGFRAIEGFIAAGLRFNQIIESSRLGIGALITAQAELRNQNGELLTGTTALAAAQGLASDQLDKLRVAGIQTAATTEDLVTSFEEAVGAGLAVGLTLDQIRRFTVSIAQAASAIHLPMNQLQQETRSILQGTIDRNSRIAKALQLTNEEIRLAKEQNRLAQLLEDRFKAFNIAGVESVKTFGALRSNIADAFSVFAGRATEPLFIRLRDAGVQALSQIFDFRSADIAESFRGMIEGLQVLFREIGDLFVDAITAAVERGRQLSRWMAENREEVQRTAQALRTMVESFGEMITSIVQAIGFMTGFGRETNVVIGIARTLSAIFQTIADNVKLILSLVAGRALIGALGRIAAAFAAIRTFGIGAAVGGAAGGPVGAAVGGTISLILGLGTAYRLLRGFQREAAVETARMTTALEDQSVKAANLLVTISSLERQLNEKGLTTEQVESLEGQLASAFQQLTDLGPRYADAIAEGTGSLEERRKKLVEVLMQEKLFLAFKLTAARSELAEAQARRAAVPAATPGGARIGPGGFPIVTRSNVQETRENLQEIDQQIAVADANVKRLEQSYRDLAATMDKALRQPAELRRIQGGTEDVNKDINDAVQRAKGELERIRSINEGMRAVIEADLKSGVLNAIDQIEIERDLALTELDAEMRVAEAQREAAQRRVIKGKVVPDKGAIDQAEATMEGIEARRVLLFLEAQGKVDQILRDRTAARNKIEEDRLRALGQHFEAARLEIERKFRDKLNEAIREFGPESQAVVNIRFVIEQETIREQAEAVEQEIRRIQENANREIENARARILGPEVGGRRRRGTAQEQQLLADEIAAANARAVASTEQLRSLLLQMREAAVDPGLRTFIDTLLTQLDTLGIKAREVDLEMKRLKEGIEEAFVGGLADFFDSLTDKTRTFAGAFRDMVRNILSDISRLVSRLLAEKIVFSILGITPAATGGQAGNLTQAEGRAIGGLGRPRHGLLRGGIPGTDSIHIAAMPDEYFTQEKAVRHYGVELFDALNNMELPRVDPRSFKPLALGGGPLEPASATARPSTRQEFHHHITVDDDGLLRVLYGRVGRNAVIKHAQTNPRALGSAINQGRKR